MTLGVGVVEIVPVDIFYRVLAALEGDYGNVRYGVVVVAVQVFPFARFQPPSILDAVQITEVSSGYRASKFFVKGSATSSAHYRPP